MKTVIVELRGKYAAALSDDGRVRRIVNKNYTVGQIIQIEADKPSNLRLMARAVSAAAAVLLLSSSAWAYYTPYCYVSLDINPSIEYSLNRFDRVLSYSAVNEDGAKIVSDLRLRNKNINDAVALTIQKIADDGYLTQDEIGNIMIAASSKRMEQSDELAAQIIETVEKTVKEEMIEVDLEAVLVDKEYVKEAKERGVTPGKAVLVKKLEESSGQEDTASQDDWLNASVKDIMKQIKENKEREKEAQKELKDKDKKEKDNNKNNNNNNNKTNNGRDNNSLPSAANKDNSASDKSDGKSN
jgi:hypothetical protein